MTGEIDRDAFIKGLREHQELACTGEILDADEVTEILTMHDENAALRARVAELEAWKERHLHEGLGELQRMGQAEEAGWQPIETAPKTEGVEFLVGVQVGDRWSQWIIDHNPSLPNDYGEDGENGDPATHWRPLPAPPTEGDA